LVLARSVTKRELMRVPLRQSAVQLA